MKYRKKPVVIDAWRFDGSYEAAVPFMAMSDEIGWRDDGKLSIGTLEGEMLADAGDWIIKGVKGELYPCKPDIFEATYEAVTS